MGAAQHSSGPARWLQLGSVLRSAWHARRNRGSMWLPILLVCLAVLLPAALWVVLPAERATRAVPAVAAILAFGVAITVWSMVVFNVLQQNQALWAAVVPGHVAALRQALYAGTAGISLCGGLFAAWAGWSMPAAMLGVAGVCAVVACAVRWPLLWFPDVVVLWSTPWLLKSGLFDVAQLAWRNAPWAFAGTVVACVVLALRAVVLAGGAGHTASQARLSAMGVMMRGQVVSGTQRPRGTGWLWALRMGTLAHAAWMHRVVARTASPVRARLAIGMGPQAHWVGIFINASFGLLIYMALMGLTLLFPDWHLGRVLRAGVLLGMAMASLVVPLQLPAALWASRREQALLTLLPGAPRGVHLNHWLAIRLAAMHLSLTVWQIAVIALIVAMAPLDPEFAGTKEAVLAALALSSLLTLGLWRDWARMKSPSSALRVNIFAATIAIGAVAAAWVFWLERPWYQLAGITALTLVPLAWWRWQRIERLPVFWPVGRM